MNTVKVCIHLVQGENYGKVQFLGKKKAVMSVCYTLKSILLVENEL